jgi:transketolase
MSFTLGSRRAIYVDISEELKKGDDPLSSVDKSAFEQFDLIYRTLCAVMYNYVPMSGHPGGSISSGRFVASILFDAMDYDVSDPDRHDADIISYAAGHKALGLYAMWALRNEIIRLSEPTLLPDDVKLQLRLEDLLGFRRNPTTDTPLFKRFGVKPLDGHPTPATPFLRLSTGASGVGVASSLGLAFGAKDYYGDDAPKVHIVEGEGGLTPGRVYEALAATGTASIDNTVLHIDWNQASIDSNHVCRDNGKPGDYVQWTPEEFTYLHDWNVISVPDGTDLQQVVAAQRMVAELPNNQPTAIVYRTTKGWQYGIEGKASHGAGHALCSGGFYEAVAPFTQQVGIGLPRCDGREQRCEGAEKGIVEECYWESLLIIRDSLESNRVVTDALARRLVAARGRLDNAERKPRSSAPHVAALYATIEKARGQTPDELLLEAGSQTTLRGALGNALGVLNKASNGAILVAAADLLGSTSISAAAKGFPEGYYNASTNPDSRVLSIGGICEDAMSGILAGLSTYGCHIGAGSSYGAFIAALGHIASRLHGIGNQSRQEIKTEPFKPYILICAHAGLKTGEDGPTHADPQPLQLLQENFPRGTAITLTPWDPQEVWPLLAAALTERPALIAPFVTRPNENVIDREALGLAPARSAAKGVYALRRARGKSDGTIVLQGSAVAYDFVEIALPLLEMAGVNLDVYYVASAELFDLLPAAEQRSIYPDRIAQSAMGITGFTLPTMYRWIRSEQGLKRTLHPFQKGRFLGSGPGEMVMKEAGLDGESQFKAVMEYVEQRSKTTALV